MASTSRPCLTSCSAVDAAEAAEPDHQYGGVVGGAIYGA